MENKRTSHITDYDPDNEIDNMSKEETRIRRVLTGLLRYEEVTTGPGDEIFENSVDMLGRDKVKAFQDKYNWFSALRGWDPYKKYSFNKQTCEFKEIT